MEECSARYLETYYGHFETLNLKNDANEVLLGSCYVPLEIVEKGNDKRSLANIKNKSISEVYNGLPLEYHEVVTGSHVVINGSSGIGKTTLCKKIVYDFYKGNGNSLTKRFNLIIWMELGLLNTFPKSKLESLSEDDYIGFVTLYFNETLGHNYQDFELAIDFQNTLFLLDGFDEVQNLIDDCQQLKYLLENIFLTKTVVLTTRPFVKLANVFDNIDQELEIIGFTSENVRKVIENHCMRCENSIEVKFFQSIANKPSTTEIMKIPILSDIILNALKGNLDRNSKQLTKTILYNKFTKKVFFNYLSINEEEEYERNLKSVIEKQVLEEYKTLCEFSLKCLESDHFHFTMDSFSENMRKKILQIGFFKQTTRKNSNSHHQNYNFIHRSFAEYFVASWIVNQSEMEMKNFVIRNKYKPGYQEIFPFISGLIENGLYNLNGFNKNDLTAKPTKNKKLANFFEYLEMGAVDLFRNYRNFVAEKCLKECTVDRNDALIAETTVVTIAPDSRSKFSTKLNKPTISNDQDIREIEDIEPVFLGEKPFIDLIPKFESKITEFWTRNNSAANLLTNCKIFLKDFSFETLCQNCYIDIEEELFYETLRVSFIYKSFLTESQKATFLARELLSNRISSVINRCTEMLGRHQQTKHPEILELICNNLDDDILGVYYFAVLEIFCELKPKTGISILVEHLNSKNVRHLLPFLFSNAAIFKSVLFIENDRLNCDGTSSHPLTERDILFIHNFPDLSRQDHHCRQIVMQTFRNGIFPSFFIKHDLSSLQRFREQEFKNRKIAKNVQAVKSPKKFHKYLSFLYANGLLKHDDLDNLHLTHLYGSFFYNSSALTFTLGPFHIDLSNSNIDDDNILPVVEFVILNRHQIHVLILSNNRIGKSGFQRLIMEVPRTQLKHLLLDRNLIQFDQTRFEMVLQAMLSKTLKTFDLSGNFISTDWITKLRAKGRNSPAAETDLMFSQLNQCKVIYKKKIDEGFVSTLDLFCKKSYREKITEEIGCFGYATKKDLFDGNGNHVLLITETMVNGQRNLKTSELYQFPDKSGFIVATKYLDPYNNCNVEGIIRKSLSNRLKEYHSPVYDYFSTDKILTITEKIEDSATKIEHNEHFINSLTSLPSHANCIKWANSIMETVTDFNIVEEKYSIFRFGEHQTEFYFHSIAIAILFLVIFLKYFYYV